MPTCFQPITSRNTSSALIPSDSLHEVQLADRKMPTGLAQEG